MSLPWYKYDLLSFWSRSFLNKKITMFRTNLLHLEQKKSWLLAMNDSTFNREQYVRGTKDHVV